MTALIAAPLLLPAVTAAATLLFMRRRRWVGAGLSIAGVAALAGIALRLLMLAGD
jgi:multicomponent K+:H+ antiporter subunit D